MALVALLICTTPVCASHLYRVSMIGRCKSTNESGKFVVKSFTHLSLVQDCAKNQEPPLDPRSLALVYDQIQDAIFVLTLAEGRPICEVLALSGGTSLTGKGGIVRERQAFLFLDGETAAGGSLTGTERSVRGTNGALIRFNLTGSFQFTTPANGTNSPAICTGNLVATRRFVPKNGEAGCTLGCPLPSRTIPDRVARGQEGTPVPPPPPLVPLPLPVNSTGE